MFKGKVSHLFGIFLVPIFYHYHVLLVILLIMGKGSNVLVKQRENDVPSKIQGASMCKSLTVLLLYITVILWYITGIFPGMIQKFIE